MAHSKTKFDAVSAARTIFSLIRTDMDAVESEYERQISSNIQFLDHLGKYLKDSGGKRVRPALLLLSYRSVLSGEGDKDVSAVRLASVMEMLHTATLVHDDIIDNADRRRNRPSINSKFGNQTAVLIGDWLYMSAFETSLAERDLEILDILYLEYLEIPETPNLEYLEYLDTLCLEYLDYLDYLDYLVPLDYPVSLVILEYLHLEFLDCPENPLILLNLECLEYLENQLNLLNPEYLDILEILYSLQILGFPEHLEHLVQQILQKYPENPEFLDHLHPEFLEVLAQQILQKYLEHLVAQ